ncbi:MAG: hypothetical protein MI717_04490 [Spirochaetales bacterium]|nr:hypothetical protein [Spirochaetales bacterium]
MRHTSARIWDQTLKALFDEVDDWLENAYGKSYSLHPNRPHRGTTANKEMDGLFNVGADFSAGYGSQLGRGYVVQVRMSTLDHIPPEVRTQIEADVETLVQEKLPVFFPGRKLHLERDGRLLKIIGDLSLGSAIKE